MFRLLAQWLLVFASATGGTLARSKALAEEVLESVYWQGYERGRKAKENDDIIEELFKNRDKRSPYNYGK